MTRKKILMTFGSKLCSYCDHAFAVSSGTFARRSVRCCDAAEWDQSDASEDGR